MTLQLVTFIYDFLYAKCYVIHRTRPNQIKYHFYLNFYQSAA